MATTEPRCAPHGAMARWLRTILTILIFGAVGMTGCGGAGGSDDEGGDGNGEIIIGLTDAEGDFATYSVDVLSLTLTKANGAVVEALPVKTRVDFAQYTDMTEFLTAATVPGGVYTKATLRLDYTNADIWVEGVGGDVVQVPTDRIVNTDGTALSTLDVSVHLEGRNALFIAAGIPAHLTLDFDLGASNRIEFDGFGVPTQTVSAFLQADVGIQEPKLHRVRGPLRSVDLAAGSYEVVIRPFIHPMDDPDERFGRLTVATTAATVFDIDGVTYQGAAGLAALAAKPSLAATVAIGDLKLNPRRFEAREVRAGSSVPGGTLDVLTGSVLARSGDTLTVRGATLVRAGGSVIFNDRVTVALDTGTVVRRQFSMASYGVDDISVGQRVMIFGTLTSPSAPLAMTASYAHMLVTALSGTNVGTPVQNVGLHMALQSINWRAVDAYDFRGTGASAAEDADPGDYEVATATLDLSGINDGTPVRVRGFVRPFGSAPDDFEAQTIINVAALPGVMVVNWTGGTGTPFSVSGVDAVTLDMSGVGLFHHLGRGGVRTDLTGGAAPSIMPQSDGAGVYLVAQHGAVQLHTDFANFIGDVQARLATGAAMKGWVATGRYDDAGATLTTQFVATELQ